MGCHGEVVLMLMDVRYHVLLQLLPGRLREAPGGLGGGQLALRPPQPLQELLEVAVETLRLHRSD